jgi:hypothetical protein
VKVCGLSLVPKPATGITAFMVITSEFIKIKK